MNNEQATYVYDGEGATAVNCEKKGDRWIPWKHYVMEISLIKIAWVKYGCLLSKLLKRRI